MTDPNPEQPRVIPRLSMDDFKQRMGFKGLPPDVGNPGSPIQKPFRPGEPTGPIVAPQQTDAQSEEADRIVKMGLTRSRERRLEPPDFGPGIFHDPETQRGAARMAGATVGAMIPGGQGVAVTALGRAGLVALGAGGADFLARMVQFGFEDDTEDKTAGEITRRIVSDFGESVAEGVTYGVIDLAVPIVGRAAGSTVFKTRAAIRAGRKGARKMMGFHPLQETPGVDQVSAPFRLFNTAEGPMVRQTLMETGNIALPHAIVDHNFVTTATKIIQRSLVTGGAFGRSVAQSAKDLTAHLNQVIDALPRLGREEAGTLITRFLEGNLLRSKGVAGAHFRNVERMMAETAAAQPAKPIVMKKISAGKFSDGTYSIKQNTKTKEWEVFGTGGANDAENRLGSFRMLRHAKEEVASVRAAAGTTETAATEAVAVGLIPTAEMKVEAKRSLDLIQGPGGLGGSVDLEKKLQKILDMPDSLSITAWHQLREELTDMSGVYGLGLTATMKADKRHAANLLNIIARNGRAAMSGKDPAILAEFELGTAIWREEVKGTLTNKLITNLGRKQGEDILDAVLASRSPTDMRALMRVINTEDPTGQAAGGIQGAFLGRIMERGSKQVTTSATGDKILLPDFRKMNRGIQDINRGDGATVNALFSNDSGRQAWNNFQRYVQSGENLIHGAGAGLEGGSPTVFFQISQAGGLGAVGGYLVAQGTGDTSSGLTTGAIVAGTAYFLGPVATWRLFRNQTAQKWLTEGLKHVPGSMSAMKAELALFKEVTRGDILQGDDLDTMKAQIPRLEDAIRVAQGRRGPGRGPSR